MLTDETSRLLTVSEAARLLRLHPHTIYRRINRGELRAFRLGEDGPLRVCSNELERWLAQYPARPTRGEL
jgi:excisionase family DNA binding protein